MWVGVRARAFMRVDHCLWCNQGHRTSLRSFVPPIRVLSFAVTIDTHSTRGFKRLQGIVVHGIEKDWLSAVSNRHA